MRIFALSFLLLFPLQVFAAHNMEAGEYILFVGKGCSHCAEVEEYLDGIELPEKIDLVIYDIYTSHEHAEFFNELTDDLSIPITERGVPFLITPDNSALFGDIKIINYFKQKIEHLETEDIEVSGPVVCGPESTECNEENTKLTIWILITAALADSVNPCAFAILILLMTSMLATGDRRRALWTGLTFIGTIFISYFAMGIGLYHALATVGSVFWIYLIVGILAVLVGLFNIKDAIWYGKGFLMEVPLSWRPKMKSLIRSITSPTGAIIIALAVSLFLLPCTSGPYIVVLGMLSQSVLNAKAISLLALYNIIFVLPMLVLAFGTYSGVSVRRVEAWRQDHVRMFHAIAGVLMLGIGIWVLLGL